MKRFYKNVGVEAQPDELAFAVLLDRKPVQTPQRKPLYVPGAPLAQAIAEEWDAQGDELVPERMPLTQIAATALDRVSPDAASYAQQIAAYGETDLVCYRADGPQALVARQSAVWQPLVDWAAEALAAPMTVTGGVTPLVQPSGTLTALRNAVEAHDPFEVAALGLATVASGSLVIALALSHGRIDADTAFEAGHLEETWQVEQWGSDEAAEVRRHSARADIEAAARFLSLCRNP